MGVDWISNLIFIVVQTSSHNSISVTNLEGQFFSTIIQGKNDLKNVNSLAVNPYKTQIYWPEGITTSDFKIQMASMVCFIDLKTFNQVSIAFLCFFIGWLKEKNFVDFTRQSFVGKPC